ncbi:hypothetical protein PR048_029698 [Dryococelus australis]|uniref:Uncharacterized protein n=1 Tax=Dryococelus australis TaxID=614101 RepID=A0ABQ9GGE0_9NEOP|nr:hypothetical protein PR048_029698 [Dryococelus australis]
MLSVASFQKLALTKAFDSFLNKYRDAAMELWRKTFAIRAFSHGVSNYAEINNRLQEQETILSQRLILRIQWGTDTLHAILVTYATFHSDMLNAIYPSNERLHPFQLPQGYGALTSHRCSGLESRLAHELCRLLSLRKPALVRFQERDDYEITSSVIKRDEAKATANIRSNRTEKRVEVYTSVQELANRVQSSVGSLWIFASGNRAGRCRWSGGFLVNSCFPCSSIPALLHTHLDSLPSALKTSMLRYAQITSLTLIQEETFLYEYYLFIIKPSTVNSNLSVAPLFLVLHCARLFQVHTSLNEYYLFIIKPSTVNSNLSVAPLFLVLDCARLFQVHTSLNEYYLFIIKPSTVNSNLSVAPLFLVLHCARLFQVHTSLNEDSNPRPRGSNLRNATQSSCDREEFWSRRVVGKLRKSTHRPPERSNAVDVTVQPLSSEWPQYIQFLPAPLGCKHQFTLQHFTTRRSSAGFLEDLLFPSPLHSDAAQYSPRFILVDSQDVDVKSRPNLYSLTARAEWLTRRTLPQTADGHKAAAN